MREEVIASGSGGQGIRLWGEILAHAAMRTWQHVSCWASYSPEVRGGEIMTTVVMTDDELRSPLVAVPQTVVLMNTRAFERFADSVLPGGLMLVDSSSVAENHERTDVETVRVPAEGAAEGLGDIRIANMIMLGAYQAIKRVVSPEAIEEALREVLPERHHRFIPLNLSALERGAALATP